MAIKQVDAKGLRCPGPTLRLTSTCLAIPPGDIIDVVADCPSFEKDVKVWCERMKKTLLWIKDEGNNIKRAQIQM